MSATEVILPILVFRGPGGAIGSDFHPADRIECLVGRNIGNHVIQM
jgi:hypothetical protein